ncbi:hypothetical protein [Sphingomonas corticis]|uniref:XRE family transcriptional regulator n=1 Tax=Sphingomonas corticis TaxID=2722791 RepID=A0ABX1CPE3_9SPHN|nr:hypothetical protein [Sphingomonas corticis]NJR79344.1 hypothetical protein [Sphingomonas corticis]
MKGSDILRQAGEALYGERWQTPLSRDLGVTDRTMRNWAAGRHDVPADVPDKLLRILRQRGDSMARLAARIEEHVRAEGDRPTAQEEKAREGQ